MSQSPPSRDSAWSLSGSVASMPLPDGVVRLDLAAAGRGLQVLRGAERRDELLGIRISPPADLWLRGPDVVALFEPDDPRRLRSTVMWRFRGERQGVVSWEITVSAQTAEPETDVAMAVHSEIDGDSLRCIAGDAGGWQRLDDGSRPPAGATAVLAGRADSTCLVAVHPDDARRVEVVRAAGRWHVDCLLFAATLEKGVLLRSRVLAAIGPRDDRGSWADRLLAEFAASPPPLTT